MTVEGLVEEERVFKGKVWWITGASSGIGAALARALGEAGAALVLSGRNVEALEAVATASRGPAQILPFEATDYAALPRVVTDAFAWRGRIDGLVNNAGVSQRSLALETAFDVYRTIVDVDLLAPIALTQQALPRMIAAGGGHVVAVASVAGVAGVPLRTAYCAAKHGLVGYHDALRAETQHLGMNVLVVCPGSVRTNVSRNALDAAGHRRGVSDEAIEAGMDPAVAADRIVAALREGRRELLLADGMEAEIARLRRTDPDALFDLLSNLMAAGYAKKMGAES